MIVSPIIIAIFSASERAAMDTAREGYLNSVNLNLHTSFPYLVLSVVNDTARPRNPGFQVMHWHEDLQFIYVLQGEIEVRTLSSSFRVCPGEGTFLNQNVVHEVRRLQSCHYNSFLFPAYFLCFYPGSPVRSFVERVTENGRLPCLHLAPDGGWQSQALSHLRGLALLEGQRGEFYPLEVLCRLACLWLVLCQNIDLPPKQKEGAAQARVQKMLRFIEAHYAEDLTLEDLAGAALVSKSECARCFQVSLHTTPMRYLAEYRLARAAELLKTSAAPIGEIARRVGFGQLSHFGKCFKEKTGLSPREYRKSCSPQQKGPQY